MQIIGQYQRLISSKNVYYSSWRRKGQWAYPNRHWQYLWEKWFTSELIRFLKTEIGEKKKVIETLKPSRNLIYTYQLKYSKGLTDNWKKMDKGRSVKELNPQYLHKIQIAQQHRIKAKHTEILIKPNCILFT